jgi:hypothetical protein
MRKLFMLVLIMGVIFANVLAVYATSTTYTSTLDISVNSTATGAYRQYYEPNHKMAMTITTRQYMNGQNYNNCSATLEKQNGLGYIDMGTQTKNCVNINSTYNYTYGNQGTGTFRYYFFNNDVASMGDSFTSNNVAMTSYS